MLVAYYSLPVLLIQLIYFMEYFIIFEEQLDNLVVRRRLSASRLL